MRRKEGSWWMRALVSIGTLALGCVLFFTFVWIAGVLGLPPSLSWVVYVVGPIIIVGVYILVAFTTLGKYLWDFPPGSLG
jgi:uncharacterized membrane protein YuzA (DUF378 family)